MPVEPDPFDPAIEALVADLTPVAPVRTAAGIAAALAATALAALLVLVLFGWRPDILAGQPHPIAIVRGIVLLTAGGALLLATVRAAVPGRSWGLPAALGALCFAVVPVGLAEMLGRGTAAFAEVSAFGAGRCLAIACGAALIVGGALVLWMRRAAPTGPARTGWFAGLAAGSLGTAAYSLFCPSETPGFALTVYPAAIAVSAVVHRAAVPRLVRW